MVYEKEAENIREYLNALQLTKSSLTNRKIEMSKMYFINEYSMSKIAMRFGVHRSTVSRSIKDIVKRYRNGTDFGHGADNTPI